MLNVEQPAFALTEKVSFKNLNIIMDEIACICAKHTLSLSEESFVICGYLKSCWKDFDTSYGSGDEKLKGALKKCSIASLSQDD